MGLKDDAAQQRVTVTGLKGQVASSQERITSAELTCQNLEHSKCEVTEFTDNIRRLDTRMAGLETNVSETRNICTALDSYLWKYLPVRTQSIVSDTLRACLGGQERRRHELYDNDKVALLYQYILEDEGAAESSQIQRDIIHLNEQARLVIDEEEKRKRRKT